MRQMHTDMAAEEMNNVRILGKATHFISALK